MATHFVWNSAQINQSSKEDLSYVVSKLSPSLSSASFENWLQTSFLRKMFAYLFLKQSTLPHYKCKHLMLWLISRSKQLDTIRQNREKDTPFARLELRTFCLPGRRTTIIQEGISPFRLTAVTTKFCAEMPNKLLSKSLKKQASKWPTWPGPARPNSISFLGRFTKLIVSGGPRFLSDQPCPTFYRLFYFF
jgi:hypothetical protein